METQQFCLKWNSHQANMLTVFEQLLSTEALVDVTLACDGLSLKAHKVVLSACSPYFQSLFVDNPCKHPIVIMKDMRYSDLKAIIDFMYKGEVNVSHDQLNALLKTAETLKVKGLAEMSGENRAASAGAVQQNTSSPPPPTNIPVTQTRSDSPAMLSKRKHGRPRKRFRSGSVHSDEEIVPTKIKEPESPEIEELPQDPSDSISDSIPVSSKHQTPVHSSAVNNSHLSRKSQSSRSSHQTEEPPSESDFSIEPSKLMEQTLTTTPVISNGLAQSSSSGISVNTPSSLSIVPTSLSIVPASCESQLSVATDSHSSNQTQGPDSPQDVKPLLSFEEPLISVDPSQDGSSFMDSSGVPSIAGTSSSYQEDQTALVPQDSQSQVVVKQEPMDVVVKQEPLDVVVKQEPPDIDVRHELEDEQYVPVEALPILKTPVKQKAANIRYSCQLCPYATTVASRYQAHFIQHSSHSSQQCPKCGKLFKNMRCMNAHLVTHEVERNFTCVYCEKKFKRKSSLTQHIKLHLDTDMFKCIQCDKVLHSNAALRRHISLLHGLVQEH